MTASCPSPSTSEPSRDEQARALCLRLLTARARTRAELAGQLTKRGYPDDVSTRVLDRLADVGLVDDVDFAEQWVHSRRVNAGKGKRALAAELHTKGVDNDVITSVLKRYQPRRRARTCRSNWFARNCDGKIWATTTFRAASTVGGDAGTPWIRTGDGPMTWSVSSWPPSGSEGQV